MTTRIMFDPMSVKKYFKNMKPPNVEELKVNGKKYIDPYFPPTEYSLTSRNSNGEYIDLKNGAENERDFNSAYPKDKHSWKRICELKDSHEWKLFTS